MKIAVMLFLLILLPFVSAAHIPPFKGLVGGKIDPNLGLIKDSKVTIIQQAGIGIIIEGESTEREEVIIEYILGSPVEGIEINWNGYTTKVRKEFVNLDELRLLAGNDNVVAIWDDTETIALACDVSCSWGFSSSTINDIIQREDIDDLWAQGFTGKGVYAMVIDTGVDAGANINIYDALTTGIDYGGNHGTSSAATIASKDSIYPGIAPDAIIIDCPAIGSDTPHSTTECFNWAINSYETRGYPQIITNSWAYVLPVSEDYYAVRKIREATDKGLIVLFAAGNCGDGCSLYGSCCDGTGASVVDGCSNQDAFRGSGRSIHGPNQLSGVITVAALDASTVEREGYSSQGPSYNPGIHYVEQKPDIAGWADFRIQTIQNSISTYTGTSASTPTVAGVIALMLDANPLVTQEDVKTILYTTARLPDACVGDCRYEIGHGLVSPLAAVLAIEQTTCGNGICEAPGETELNCAVDCLGLCGGIDCDDGNTCTIDKCATINNLPVCQHIPEEPCCGNGLCEIGEGVWQCAADCDVWACEDNCEYELVENRIVPRPNAECAIECHDFCGDGVCSMYENYVYCEADCEQPPAISYKNAYYLVIGALAFLILVGVLRRK